MPIYVIQIVIACITILIGIFLLKLANTLKKVHRISKFSLDIPKDNTSILTNITNGFFKIIHNLSDGLSRYNFVKKLSLKYDKYILEINRDRTSPVDYFTIKLLLVIIALSLCLLGVVLSILPASPFIFIVVFLASYFLPDLFWKYLYIKRTNRIVKDVFISTVVDSSLKNNKDANEEVKTLEENTDKVVEEIQESEIEEKKEEKPKEEQVSLNDFFDEFKI